VAVNLTTMLWRASNAVPNTRFSEVARLAYGYFGTTDNLANAGQSGVRIFRVNRNGVPIFVTASAAGDTPEGIAAADSGRTFFVTNINSNSVMRFALGRNGRAKLTGIATTAARPFGVAVDGPRNELFVADNDTATLSGARANPGLERFSLPSMKRLGTVLSTGSKASLPLGVAVDQTLARLFVTNEGDANVVVFALPSMRRIATLAAGLTPWLPAIDERAHRLYVPNARANSISIYDTRGLRTVNPGLSTCAYPTGVAVAYPQAGHSS
jgi:DNA-binding beta-propeller fold protein YncE